jgi:hypothetical protein
MKESSLLSKFLNNFMQVLSVIIPILVVSVGLIGLMVLLADNLPFWLYIILMPLSITAILTFIVTGLEELDRSERRRN